ncbi:Putative fatty acyl-CoA reductase CG5065 [Eumeta japonica]|uniref:Fatty acyl-CoA reductase n=1 Tax=Eumeta variegata TaxID=151549 RepID=A0A4C1XSN0_EUMVA|nr:Putative fatty acyl-CoA reductase CG5065 [Eumeta japonica]
MEQVLSLDVSILEHSRNLRKLEESGDSEIQKFFAGKTVLVTGGTGFLGKQLIEKLLRSCRDIDRIYLLLRPKKGKDVTQRLQEQLADPCYDTLRKYDQNFGVKIVGIEGDTGELGLALSGTNRKVLLNEVDVIFHGAATVRFDDHIKKAVLTNVRGTREVLLLAAECKHLSAFVHVSTAYSHAPRSECKEEFYPSPIASDLMIEMAETVDEDILERITPGLIGDWPNTYTFSKALAEDQLKRLAVEHKVPAGVIRPAIGSIVRSRDFSIRQKVYDALYWLVVDNPLYKDVTIDTNVIINEGNIIRVEEAPVEIAIETNDESTENASA